MAGNSVSTVVCMILWFIHDRQKSSKGKGSSVSETAYTTTPVSYIDHITLLITYSCNLTSYPQKCASIDMTGAVLIIVFGSDDPFPCGKEKGRRVQ